MRMVRTVRFTTRRHELVGHLERCATVFSLDSSRVQFLCREGTELKGCKIFKPVPQHTTTATFGTSTMAAGFGFSDLSGYVSVQYPYASLFATPEDFPQYVPASILAPASPDLAYLYDIFEDTSGVQPSQESEIVLNPSLPHYNPAPSSFSPQIASPVSDAARASTTYSVPIPSSPPAPGPSQTVMGYPSNRRKIPQTVYGLGKKRRDYQPSEPILFHVNGRPGVNMGDALRKEFAGLDGRDDLMFQGGVNAFSCRLMVRSLRQLPPRTAIDGPVQFPGYPANSQLQV